MKSIYTISTYSFFSGKTQTQKALFKKAWKIDQTYKPKPFWMFRKKELRIEFFPDTKIGNLFKNEPKGEAPSYMHLNPSHFLPMFNHTQEFCNQFLVLEQIS